MCLFGKQYEKCLFTIGLFDHRGKMVTVFDFLTFLF
jgi:hypothetical protein